MSTAVEAIPSLLRLLEKEMPPKRDVNCRTGSRSSGCPVKNRGDCHHAI